MPAPVLSQAYLNSMPAGLRPLDISNEMLKYRPAETTILTLMMAFNRVAVDDRVFRINIQDQNPDYVTMVSVDDATHVTVSQDDAKLVFPGMSVIGAWNIGLTVSNVNLGTGQITFDPAFGSTAGLAANGLLSFGSRAVEELAQRPTVVSYVPAQVENFLENAWDVSGQSRWVEHTRFYGGLRQYHNQEQCRYEHKRSIDRGMWFNKKGITTGPQGNTLYKSGGIFNMIQTNIFDFGGTFTINKLRTSMTIGTRFMRSGTIWLFVSRLGWELIDRAAFNKGNMALGSGGKDWEVFYDINIKNFMLAGKAWKMMCVDHFTESCSDTMVAIDPAALEIKTSEHQKTKTRGWMQERTLTMAEGLTTDGTLTDLWSDWGTCIQEKACMLMHGASTLGTES